MDDDDELRMLRARAYGPGADIHLDDAALRRLRELEHAAAAPLLPAPSATADAATSTHARDVPTDESVPTQADPALDELTARHPRRRAAYRRALVAVVAGVALLASAGAGAAIQAATRPASDGQSSGRLVETVGVDPDFSWPSQFPEPGNLRAIGFSDIHGITVVAIPPSSAAARGWCMFTFETARIDVASTGYSGDSQRACDAGPFPASVAVDLARAPRSLREAFPDAAGLRFVLDADRREVLVYEG